MQSSARVLREARKDDAQNEHLREALQDRKSRAFLVAKLGQPSLQHDPVTDTFRCGCNRVLEPHKRPIERHLCKQVDLEWEPEEMRLANMLDDNDQCILCGRPVSTKPHRCLARCISRVTHDFTGVLELPRPLPPSLSHLDSFNAKKRRDRLERNADERRLQGKVVVVMPQADMQGRREEALQQGRLCCFVGAVAMSSLVPTQLGLYTMQPLRSIPDPDRYRPRPSTPHAGPYAVPLSEHFIAPYTGELIDEYPDSADGHLEVLTTRSGHMLDPCKLGGVAVLANTAHEDRSRRVNADVQELPRGIVPYLFAKLPLGVGVEVIWDYNAVVDTQEEFDNRVLNPLCLCCKPPRPLMSLRQS